MKTNVLVKMTTDYPFVYEVIDIKGVGGDNPSVPVVGLDWVERLEISSWIYQSELKGLKKLNKNIFFKKIVEMV